MHTFRFWLDKHAYQGLATETYATACSPSWVSFHNYNSNYEREALLLGNEPKAYMGRLGLMNGVNEIVQRIDDGATTASEICIAVDSVERPTCEIRCDLLGGKRKRYCIFINGLAYQGEDPEREYWHGVGKQPNYVSPSSPHWYAALTIGRGNAKPIFGQFLKEEFRKIHRYCYDHGKLLATQFVIKVV